MTEGGCTLSQVRSTSGWSAGHCAALAASLEASIPKAGNVHRAADFSDTSFLDFLVAAQILGNCVDTSPDRPLGEVVQRAVEETRLRTGNNPNLGIVLLLVPLCRLAQTSAEFSQRSMERLLQSLTREDARRVYSAIRTAAPGGLGSASSQDVNTTEEPDLLSAMRSAAHRDLIARQYAGSFAQLLGEFPVSLAEETARQGSLERGVTVTHIRWIAGIGDSLIERKCGAETAEEARARARYCEQGLESGWTEFEKRVSGMDDWLRADGNRRNPGAIADLMAATLFVAFWTGKLDWPGIPSAQPIVLPENRN